MPKDIHQRDTAQQRSSRLLLAMGIIVLLGALAYFVLTLVVNRRTPASPDTHYTAENGISVYYESAVWPVCEMTEDSTLGRALELASAQSSDDANYQVVLFQFLHAERHHQRDTRSVYEGRRAFLHAERHPPARHPLPEQQRSSRLLLHRPWASSSCWAHWAL